ncbi:MAG TPA: MlaD family protein [Candidatus Acidoferrum sp.]|nr:MlaD family protein [Candidatus Acidoferrum sp.]
MSESRFAGKVGLFVVVGIVLIAVLMLNFSRGVGLFKPKYEIKMRMGTVAGLKISSAVYLSGVQIGNVDAVELDPTNKNVVVTLSILKQYPLRKDSRFMIDQIGVLGDQFVTITPGSLDAPPLNDGDEVPGQEPFNFQEVARSANDLLRRFEQLGGVVEEAVKRVNTHVLDTQTLSNLSRTISNFQEASDTASTVVDNLGVLITNNAPAITMSLSNLLAFTDRLRKIAGDLDETVATNRNGLNVSMHNLEQSTASLKKLTADAEAGHGIVGGLFRDEQMRGQVSQTLSNLSILSSNLNRYGLLYKPKQPKETKEPIHRGKSPF